MKPGIKTMIFGAALFIFGAVIVPLLFVVALVCGKSNSTQFKVPGILETTVKSPGRYYLCNDFRTLYNGKTYDNPTNLPAGIEIKIFDANGNSLLLVSDTSFSEGRNGSEKTSIGYVDLKNVGKVRIEVSGGTNERIFSFGPANFFKLAGLILGGFVLSALVSLTGIVIGIRGVIKLVKSSR